uniref:Uncharacterized protein n=1 Tax=Noctiluca scintillans TaxID=2966 RepID=A0A7S1A6Y3_NOCSC|mmetsp:Transcript_34126/g.91048  ORF Transcript_34126/g.91048 Transcript_34126/m.91048 type:complete len:181 (+) Transcript_34126:329-871(+)
MPPVPRRDLRQEVLHGDVRAASGPPLVTCAAFLFTKHVSGGKTLSMLRRFVLPTTAFRLLSQRRRRSKMHVPCTVGTLHLGRSAVPRVPMCERRFVFKSLMSAFAAERTGLAEAVHVRSAAPRLRLLGAVSTWSSCAAACVSGCAKLLGQRHRADFVESNRVPMCRWAQISSVTFGPFFI